jgi:thiamine kinase-like enzyme
LNKINIIDDLYSIGLYDTWRDSIEEVECSVKDIYERFIDGDKIFQEIGNILNLNLKDVYLNELYLNFNKIWNHSFKFNQKICHGDLHSENFFIDNKGVYLIDFGYTGIQHAIIDHTSLECSLKFKHLPFYIQQNELNDIEEELILDVSFNLSHRFTKTKRKDLLEMLDVIKKIRSNSISLLQDGNSKVEYLISLFIMTFRQIRYPDMNQFYAYNSALIISRKIVQQLSL